MTDSAYRLVRPAAAVPAAPPELDTAQRAVVEHPGGPLLVLAGPGTGKTTTLVETVAARVAGGARLENVLMLTFSRRAASEMRDRVAARLGRTVREPVARTLHSYAFGLLRIANRRSQGGDDPLPPPRLLTGAEQDIIVRDLLAGRGDAAWPEPLRPAFHTSAFAGELRDLVLRAVERGLLGVDLAELGRRHGRPDWQAAGRFLTEYEDVTSLAKPGAYDPAELIRSAVNALQADPELLAAERARRRHVFVDEYQDTDPAQAELLALLTPTSDELVLVGDPDQSIYAFRGADESALRDVDARFGRGAPVPVVALSVSRRSGPELVAAARRVAARLPGRGEHRQLHAAGADPVDGPAVEVSLFASASAEANHVAGVLRRAHLDGMPWSRMAVLVRSTTAVLGTLRRALLTAGVPVAVRGDDLPLAEQPAVAMLLELLRCALEPRLVDEDVAERLLLGPVGRADVVSLQRLRRAVSRLVGPDEPVRVAPALLDEKEARILPESVRWPVTRVASALAAGRAAVAAGGSAEDVLWALWDATGLARRWSAQSAAGGPGAAAADRDLDAVIALFDAAARFTDRLPRAGVGQFVDHVAAQQVPGDGYAGEGEGAGPGAVTILTAHAAKGLEWDLVCVAGVQEGRWPDLRVRGSLLGTEQLVDVVAGLDPAAVSAGAAATRIAEERRLFYVAVTRARSRLLVTAVRGEDEQPSRFLDELDPVTDERPVARPQRPAHLSGLVAFLRAMVCDDAVPAAERNAAAGELARLAEAGVPGADPDQWWGLAPLSGAGPVADPDHPVPVSPSRIDSFLRCELRTLLQDLGAKDGQELSASLGTLVHEVAAEAPPGASLDTLQQMVDERWRALDFGATWFGKNERTRAGAILTKLVDWLRSSRDSLELVAVEEGFRVVVGDAVLTGRVDRVERDGDGRLVVVDLKTGKSKVRGDDLPQHPQLGAYQLAVAEGGFGEGEQPGGAVLVQLAASGKDPEQWQPPLAEREWIEQAVAQVASRMRGSEFTAQINSYCGNCDLVSVCPLQNGRQVTS